MSEGIRRFLNSIKNTAELKATELIELFVYYLTVEVGEAAATAKTVNGCFAACDLTAPTRTSPYLTESLKSKPQKFVKVDGGIQTTTSL